MDKKKIIVLVLSVILIMSMYMTYRTYENKPKELLEEKEKIETKKKQFAMYIKEGDKYVEYKGQEGSENLFPTGYKLNTDKSRCEDIDGNKIEDISFNTNTNSITVTSNKTSYCYLYFDLKVITPQELIESRESDEGLSDEQVGGMYRYQGEGVNNYICLGSINQTNCEDQSDNMYRIIGITSEGNIKVMKQTKYTDSNGTYEFAWNTNYTDSTCGDIGCPEWPNSELYNTINETFYGTLDSTIKEKIEPQKWWYGDMHNGFVGTLSADEVYKVETGQMDTKYYGHSSNDKAEVTNQRWTQMNTEAPIGLIYLHDYYYQAKQDSCHSTKNSSYANCISQGWMHISKNGGTSVDNEWTMTRSGRPSKEGNDFGAWLIRNSGYSGPNAMFQGFLIRPVFYLTNDIELQGEGTYNNPFYISK